MSPLASEVFFLKNGEEVLLKKTISVDKEKKYLVQQIYFFDDEDCGKELGEPYLVNKVYKNPPIKKLAAEIAELQDKRRDLERQLIQEKVSLNKIRQEFEEIQKLREEYKPIDRMLNVITYKAKYFVIHQFTIKSSYHLNHEAEFNININCCKVNSRQAEVSVRIDEGDVIPCVSEEEAIEIVKKNILALYEKSDTYYISGEVQSLSKKYNIPIPTKILKDKIKDKIRSERQYYDQAKSEYTSRGEKLDLLDKEMEKLTNIDE